MKYYFSSPSCAKSLDLDSIGIRNVLLSYAVDANNYKKFLWCRNIIIDSGAFSVFNSGKTIKLEKYIKFCQKLPKHFIFVALDVIPPIKATISEIDRCCQQSFQNYMTMKYCLPNVLPVYHRFEDIKWFKKYLDNTDYIGIGIAFNNKDLKNNICRRVFQISPKGTKIHALGCSTWSYLLRYPFYSSDSITYVRHEIRTKHKNMRCFLAAKDFRFYLRKNVQRYIDMENFVTRAWEKRGVIWDA